MNERMESWVLPANAEDNTALEIILRATQPELKTLLQDWLRRQGYTPVSRRGYLYAAGSVPVLLVAHLDTVHREPVRDICYNADRTVVMSPQGIGGDDRAGVWMILSILSRARCHVLFCEDEEIGCVGARRFARSALEPQVNYLVEMDRRGSNDAVFYQCDNPDFTEYIRTFGFEPAYGSCSDISYLAPSLGVAAVNLSCGYYCEHQRYEYIRLDQMCENAIRIAEMVAKPSHRFEYHERSMEQDGFWQSALWAQGLKPRREIVMALPHDARVTLYGRELRKDQFCVDQCGNVYRFLPALQGILPVEQARALDGAGKPVAFRAGAARRHRVLSVEEALEQMQERK